MRTDLSSLGWPLMMAFCAILVVFGAGRAAAADAPASAGLVLPTYEADPCCSLCPRVNDPNAYQTTYLKDYRYLVAGDDGWLFRSEVDLASDLRVPDEVYSDLARFQKAMKARGTQVLLFSIPPRGLVEASKLQGVERNRYDYASALKSYGEQLGRLRDLGFIVPDYTRLADEKESDDFFFRRDVHWKPAGARRTAQLIADAINALPLRSALPPKSYETRLIGLDHSRGTMSQIAATICGGQYAQEVAPNYETTAPPPSDLFGDEAAPEVALVGTSMSANPNYHFAGFLQELLHTDLFNVALPGGGFDGAMTQYLMSDAFQKHPPKLLIWEFAFQHLTRANHGVMRRLLPLVDNGCASRPALLKNTATLRNDDDLTEVLFNGGGQINPTRSSNLTVDLQFQDPNVKEIMTEIWYLDGKHEVLRARYNDFTSAAGRFVLELNREPDYASQPMIDFRVQLVTQLPKPTTVKATMCSNIAAP